MQPLAHVVQPLADGAKRVLPAHLTEHPGHGGAHQRAAEGVQAQDVQR